MNNSIFLELETEEWICVDFPSVCKHYLIKFITNERSVFPEAVAVSVGSDHQASPGRASQHPQNRLQTCDTSLWGLQNQAGCVSGSSYPPSPSPFRSHFCPQRALEAFPYRSFCLAGRLTPAYDSVEVFPKPHTELAPPLVPTPPADSPSHHSVLFVPRTYW